MNLSKYPLVSNGKLTAFEFVSEGHNGLIHKIVQYKKTNLMDVYNLSLGDKNQETGEIDDLSISNNGDSEKVLSTVVSTLYAFTDKHPEYWVYLTGSTKARTRLYRMGITKYLSEIKLDFEILGEKGDIYEVFRKNVEYDGFFVQRNKKNY